MPLVTHRFNVGEVIAQKYLLLNLVGRGASGEVFRSRNILAGNVLALKLLMEDASRNATLVQRFFREARAINRVGHPNIVSVFDAGFADGIPYLAMEYLAGESLGQVLERMHKLSLPCAVAIMLKVLDALEAAHRAQIVHRDLKPANVFLRSNANSAPTIKLLDFGVAKIREEGEGSIRTESGMILGTPDYLSPEQITSDREIDGRSDLFSAGSLLFELVCGQRPFHGQTFVTTTYRIVHEPAPDIAASGGPDGEALSAVLARALCKDPEQRFATAREFALAIESLCPDPSEREEALCALAVRPASDERAETAPARRESVVPAEPAPSPVAGRNSQAATVETEWSSPISRPLSEAPRKPARTWSDFPIVGRRRMTPAPSGHVRGTVLLAIDRAVTTRYGGDVREEIIEALPRPLRRSFRDSSLRAEAWYDLATVRAYVQECNTSAVRGQSDKWRALGYAGVETDLLTLLRSVRAKGDGQAALRTAIPICAGLFDFGHWTLDLDADALIVQVTEFADLPEALWDWVAGVLEHAVRATGHPYRVQVQRRVLGEENAPVEFMVSLHASI